jgi:hypothetical protein
MPVYWYASSERENEKRFWKIKNSGVDNARWMVYTGYAKRMKRGAYSVM